MDAERTQTVRVAKVTRLGVRKVTRAHLALGRRPQLGALAQEGLEAACAQLGERLGVAVSAQARLLPSALAPMKSVSSHAAFAVLELSALGELALLEVELPLVAALSARLLGTGAPPAAFGLTRMEESAFGFLCLTALGALRHSAELERLCAPRLVRVHADRAAAVGALELRWGWLAVELALQAGDASGVARLFLPAQPLQSALAAVPEQLPAVAAPELLAGTIGARVRVGRTRLPAQALAELAHGDVVLLDGLRRVEGALAGAARLFAPAFTLRGELTPHGLRVLAATTTALPQSEEDFMVAEPIPVHPSPIPALDVDLEVELTRVRLSLAELSSLRAGTILPLRCNAAEPVTLWLGDRPVARAELVEVEGELGARILHLNP